DQIFGRYIKQFGPEDQIAFDTHYRKSSRVGEIIGDLFKKLAHEPFQKNQDLMKKYNLPSLSDLSYGELPEDSTCSPHITFTTKSFFNPPRGRILESNHIHFLMKPVAETNSSLDLDDLSIEFPEDGTQQNFNPAQLCHDSKYWKQAIEKQLNSIESHNVWDNWTEEPPNPLNTTWVFKIKGNMHCELLKFKGRLCVQGFNQIYGTD
ncbi:hypothetical protein VP01_5314g1, partial [Puccinia sorghi]